MKESLWSQLQYLLYIVAINRAQYTNASKTRDVAMMIDVEI